MQEVFVYLTELLINALAIAPTLDVIVGTPNPKAV